MSKEEPRKPFKALDGCVMAQEIVNEASSLEEAKKQLENLVYCVLQRDLELMSENFKTYYGLSVGLSKEKTHDE